MNIEQEIEDLFDNLRKLLFYVGHGKYNDYMSLEDVGKIQKNLEMILDVEKEYKLTKTLEEKESIYKRLEPFKTFSIRDFLDYKVQSV